MTKIIGIGNALVDVLVHLADETRLNALQLPKGGMSHVDRPRYEELAAAVSTLSHEVATGGSAANTIHAMSLLGDEVGYVGTVGADEMGRFFASRAEERGIDARLRVIHGGDTGVATTFITADGERTFATYLGVAPQIEFHPESDFIGNDAILHVEGYLVQDHDFIEQVLRSAKEAGMRVSYDLASWNIVQADREFVQHLVREYVDIVFANETESKAFTKCTDPVESLREIAGMCQVAVVKVGKDGSWVKGGSEEYYIPAWPAKPIDATGAGDTYAAGFLYAHSLGLPLKACGEVGSIIAAKVVEVVGTKIDVPRWREAKLEIRDLIEKVNG
jgi:sugar/nucleoside kinase (ribokinase family)